MPGGRPKIEVNWEEVDKLAGIFCTAREICSFTGVSEDTMLRRCKEMHGVSFAEYINQKRDLGRISLRRKQYEIARSGDKTMLIFLGKVELGQREEAAMTGNHTIKLQYSLPGGKDADDRQVDKAS